MIKKIILASTSPRRKVLMKKLGINFQAVDAQYREIKRRGYEPARLVKFLARGKAKKAARKYPGYVIIAADTVVEFQGEPLGKPKNMAEASRVLMDLSGKASFILTGLAVVDPSSGKIFSLVRKTKVSFKKLTEKVIKDYVQTREPLGRAGSFALDATGRKLIKKIAGDKDSAIGLPVKDLKKILKRLKAI